MLAISRGIVYAGLVGLCAGAAPAQFLDANYGAALNYGSGASAANDALMLGMPGTLDDPAFPGAQLWHIMTTVAPGGSVNVDLTVQDATALFASDPVAFQLDLASGPDGGGLAVAGPLTIRFTPQMGDPDQAVPLVEGVHWSQTATANGVGLMVSVVPAAIAPQGTFPQPQFDEITDLHVGFQVVPEPSTLGLLLVTVLAGVRRPRR